MLWFGSRSLHDALVARVSFVPPYLCDDGYAYRRFASVLRPSLPPPYLRRVLGDAATLGSTSHNNAATAVTLRYEPPWLRVRST